MENILNCSSEWKECKYSKEYQFQFGKFFSQSVVLCLSCHVNFNTYCIKYYPTESHRDYGLNHNDYGTEKPLPF